MLNIEKYKKNNLFKLFILKQNEVLFEEWDIDNNIYIIEEWNLQVEKYINKNKNETKVLAILTSWSIFWEGSLSNSNPKEVRIVAQNEVSLLKISVDDFEQFILQDSKSWIKLLSEIIEVSNKRLLESNLLLTSNYNLSKYVAEIEEFNYKAIFSIFDEYVINLDADKLIYIEKNPVIETFAKIKYNSKDKWLMLNEIIELKNWKINLENIEEIKNKNYIISPLINKRKIIWFIILISEKWFTEWQKKIISSTWTMLAWIIKQRQYFEEIKSTVYTEI